MKHKLTILNLISVFVVAFGLTTFLHEFTHAITAKIVSVDSVLFHSYVSYDNSKTPLIHQIYILSSGPLVSFFQAIIFLTLLQRKVKIDFISFFYLWMSVIGMIVFLGYIMMGPFMPYGDTGKIYAMLSTQNSVSFSLSILALIAMIFFFRKLTNIFVKFLLFLKHETGLQNNQVLIFLFISPIIIGTILNVLISLPAPTTLSLVFPAIIPITMIPSIVRLYKSNWFTKENLFKENSIPKITFWPIIAIFLIIVISRILTIGIDV